MSHELDNARNLKACGLRPRDYRCSVWGCSRVCPLAMAPDREWSIYPDGHVIFGDYSPRLFCPDHSLAVANAVKAHYDMLTVIGYSPLIDP